MGAFGLDSLDKLTNFSLYVNRFFKKIFGPMGNEGKLGWKQARLHFSQSLTTHPGESLYLFFFTKKVENGVISQTKYET
jgi:hypothetical protein